MSEELKPTKLTKVSCPHCTATCYLQCFACRKPLAPDLRAIDEAIAMLGTCPIGSFSVRGNGAENVYNYVSDGLQKIRLKYLPENESYPVMQIPCTVYRCEFSKEQKAIESFAFEVPSGTHPDRHLRVVALCHAQMKISELRRLLAYVWDTHKKLRPSPGFTYLADCPEKEAVRSIVEEGK